MSRPTRLYAVAALLVLGATFYQVVVRGPALEKAASYTKPAPINHDKCISIPELKACEKISIHPSGLIYLACAGSIESRTTWMPTLDALNASAVRSRTTNDYVATYDIHTGKIIKLIVNGLAEPRGLNLHGMDVVVDKKDPRKLWVYLVNHRPSLDLTIDSLISGADSVVEVFQTSLGSNYINWVQTVEDAKVMLTPNDIAGSADGQEFWFTNDNGSKTGRMRGIAAMLSLKSTFIGYCHLKNGCKIASTSLHASNGIVRTSDGLIMVGNYRSGGITIHKQQKDKTLQLIQKIDTGLPLDNLALSTDGAIIAAAFPNPQLILKAARNVSQTVPSAVLRITKTLETALTAKDNAYTVEKIYEDEGELGSFATTAAMYNDTLYIHGLMAHRMLACKVPLPRQESQANRG